MASSLAYRMDCRTRASVRGIGHAEPGAHLASVGGRCVHGIVYTLDAAVADGERQALEVAHAAGLEERQRQRLLEGERLVADDLERQSEAVDHLLLVARRLRREPEHNSANLLEARVEVAEAFGLRRRAMRARNVVPTRRIGETGPPRPRIAVDDHAAGQPREAYGA